MTVISKRVFRPLPGKAALAQSRVRRLSETIARLGGSVRVATVAWGDGARDLHLYGVFESMQAGAKVFSALAGDSEGLHCAPNPKTIRLRNGKGRKSGARSTESRARIIP